MTRISRTARKQLLDLIEFDNILDRPEAERNLRAYVASAISRIDELRGLPAPRPYPHLFRPGWLWFKEGPYWIAFKSNDGDAVIQVVFHESADLSNRL